MQENSVIVNLWHAVSEKLYFQISVKHKVDILKNTRRSLFFTA